MTNVSITTLPLPVEVEREVERDGLTTTGTHFENDMQSLHFYNHTNFTTAIPFDYSNSTGLNLYSQVLGIEFWQLILICSCVLLAILGVIAMLFMWKFIKPKPRRPPLADSEAQPAPGARSVADGATTELPLNKEQQNSVAPPKQNFCPCFKRSKNPKEQNPVENAANESQNEAQMPGILAAQNGAQMPGILAPQPENFAPKPRLPPIPEEMNVSRKSSLVTLSKVYPVIKGIPNIQIPPDKFRPLPPLQQNST